ncbi:hypothetical protein Bca4012_038899 [Brassica carinata]
MLDGRNPDFSIRSPRCHSLLFWTELSKVTTWKPRLLDPLPTTPSLQFTTRRAPIDRDTKPEPLNPMLSATNHQPFNPSLLNRSLDESVLLDVSSQNDDAAWTEEMARDRSSGGYGG